MIQIFQCIVWLESNMYYYLYNFVIFSLCIIYTGRDYDNIKYALYNIRASYRYNTYKC
jgi:hypothetical protein